MTQLNQINYQPLLQLKGSTSKTIKNSFGGLGWVVFAIVLIASIGLMFLGGFGIFTLVIYFIYIGYKVNKYKNLVWEEFASANGWMLDTETSELELLPPSTQFGHGQKFSPVIKADLGGLACDLFTYNTTTGSGKSSQTHYFTIAKVALPTMLPSILLTSKKAHADLQNNMGDKETLKLEGDFQDYFNLQVEKGKEIDVLAILTPDVMQALVNYNQKEDIEIFNDDLYFILNSDKRDLTSVESLIQSAVNLSEQIIQNLKFRGLANQSQPVQSAPAQAAVSTTVPHSAS